MKLRSKTPRLGPGYGRDSGKQYASGLHIFQHQKKYGEYSTVTQHLVRLIALTVLVAMITGCSDETAPVPTSGSIFVKVLTGAELTPVAGALVTTQPPTSSVLTDSAGQYRFTGVTPGTYVVTAQRVGVGAGTSTINVVGGAATTAVILFDGVGPQSELPPVTDGLAVFFPLDNSADVQVGASRVSSNVLRGALATTDRKNRQGKATRFIGEDTSYLVATLDAALQRVPVTISFWLRKDGAPKALETILSKYLHPSGDGIHFVYEGQNFTAAYMASNFGNYSRSNVQHPSMNRWVHVAYVCGPTICALYLDGQLVSSTGWATGRSTNTFTNEQLYVGFTRSTAISGSPLTAFKGSIDDLAWYNRELTTEEVKMISDDR